jgi:UDP-2,3-diacylglucosamine pyrophosphatase LpxH
MLDAVILSDIHLGSNNCQGEKVCRLLGQIIDGELPTARLILNGDVLDSTDFRRLGKNDWKVLSLVSEVSSRIAVTWLCGNHDGAAEIVARWLGVALKEDYILETGPQRVLLLHGHIFDDFLDNHPVLTWLADCVYSFLQWIDRTHYCAKLAKHGSKTFLRCAKKVEDEAVELARRKDCTAVCCGHTHAAVAHGEQPIAYFNGGCWTELPCTYLTVADGAVRLHTFRHECDAAGKRREAPAAPATTPPGRGTTWSSRPGRCSSPLASGAT